MFLKMFLQYKINCSTGNALLPRFLMRCVIACTIMFFALSSKQGTNGLYCTYRLNKVQWFILYASKQGTNGLYCTSSKQGTNGLYCTYRLNKVQMVYIVHINKVQMVYIVHIARYKWFILYISSKQVQMVYIRLHTV